MASIPEVPMLSWRRRWGLSRQGGVAGARGGVGGRGAGGGGWSCAADGPCPCRKSCHFSPYQCHLCLWFSTAPRISSNNRVICRRWGKDGACLFLNTASHKMSNIQTPVMQWASVPAAAYCTLATLSHAGDLKTIGHVPASSLEAVRAWSRSNSRRKSSISGACPIFSVIFNRVLP